MRKFTIVGGGITGLTAAFYAERYLPEDVTITLLEATDRLGGKIDTYETGEFAVERGPDSYVFRKTAMTELIEDVGLGDELVRNGVGQAYVLHHDGLHPIPKQTVMGIPLDVNAFRETTLLSEEEHEDLKQMLLSPPDVKAPDSDVSLGLYLRERVGDPIVDRLIEPLLSGIYAGDIDQMSAMSTFPQFIEGEKKYGNLYEGMRHLRPEQRVAEVGAKKVGQFASLKRGLKSLTDRLAERLDRTEIVLNCSVEQVSEREDGYRLFTNRGDIDTDHLVLTVPPRLIRQFLPKVDSDFLADMKPHATATCSLVFKKEDIELPFVGTGFVTSQEADVTITACTFIDQKWPHAVPEGYHVLRVFLGRPGADEIVEASDEEIIETALHDLRGLMKIHRDPIQTVVSRLRDGLPPYAVFHADRVKALRAEMSRVYPGVILAGIAYDGIGMPDCVKSVREQVKALREKN
ncbi:protoporphyrinogen oxidase [Exiguobacterium sp. N5]|uniref:protoporphyrinogen oxidase n=1 Tax=unclassified Exiguobacterium TaxID=2644629 RepID=UPI001BE9E461|nr:MULTISPECIES: protoporphyrinogen oxidase [unclassified Exiguobacterium]MCV9898544.1 protoporphyrinogen oxidase [Exiguobacterium sp. N5]